MTNPSLDLFLLLTNLAQIRARDTVISRFVEGLNELFPRLNAAWAEASSSSDANHTAVCTRRATYGYLHWVEQENADSLTEVLLQNACQMLAILLEKLEQEQVLLEQKDALEQIATDRMHLAQELEERVVERTKDVAAAYDALWESEETYRLAMEATADGLWDWNVESGRVDYSPGWSQILGLEEVPACYETWEQRIHPDDAQSVQETLKRHLTGHVDHWRAEHRLITTDDRWVWVLGRGRVVVRAADGKPIRMVGTMTDITERKRVEDALKRSREMLNLVLDTVPQSVFWKDMHGFYMGCNRVFAEAIGFEDPAEIVGKTDFDLPWPREEAEAYRADDRYVIETNRPKMHIIEPLQQADGARLIIDTSKVPLRDANGHPFGVLGIYEDITARRRAETEVRLLTDTITASLNEIYIFDAETLLFSFVNEGALRNLGYGSEEIRRMTPVDIKPDFTKETFEEAIAPLRRREIPITTFVTVHQRADGSTYPVEAHMQLMEREEGNVFLAVIEDITDRKRAEEERENLREQLQQSQKMESVGRLAGGVAHDFNNMLGVILGYAEVAMTRMTPEDSIYGDLVEIQKAAQRSADLTRQLLTFARRQVIAPRVLDLNQTVDGMTKMLKRLIGEDIDLKWNPGADLWPVKIDPSQVDQILANLCVNARDAIEGIGKVTIETQNCTLDNAYCDTHAEADSGDFVMIAVSDNGSGMTDEIKTHLFEPFFTNKEKGKGTGLGLATVYGVVKQNGGFINVYSEPGRGSTFKIYLPKYAARVAPMEPPTADRPAPCGTETILVVEDEPAILRMAKLILERQSYSVLAVNTPGEAIRIAREHPGAIDLVVTDVVMPEMNGRELTAKLAKIRPDMKCLFMSGYTANVIAHHGVLDEGVDFIQKPFQGKALAAKIREILDRN